jgi:hypothetical protein
VIGFKSQYVHFVRAVTFFLLISIFQYQCLAHDESCLSYFAQKLEDPLKISKFLQKRGLDSDLIIVDRGDSVFKVFYEGKLLLEFTLYKNFYDLTYPHTMRIRDQKGLGFGTVSYLLLARQLYIENHDLLASDMTLSKDALRIWRRFVDLGLAEDHGSYFQFTPKSMESDLKWREVDEILSRTPPPKSFFKAIYRKLFQT